MIDYWIWRYVYATFKKSANWPNNQSWVAYNIAYTIKESNSDKFITKIVWDYDEESCYNNKDFCPSTLIWSMSWTVVTPSILLDWSFENWDSDKDNYWIPYAAKDFATK